MSDQPQDNYEAPAVEQVDAEDYPAVTVAGSASDSNA